MDKCPKCGGKMNTDDNIYFYCKNLSCINAWFGIYNEERRK